MQDREKGNKSENEGRSDTESENEALHSESEDEGRSDTESESENDEPAYGSDSENELTLASEIQKKIQQQIFAIANSNDDDFKQLRKVFQEAGEVNAKTKDQALVQAVNKGNYKIARFLIQQHADVNVRAEETGNSVLSTSIHKGYSDITKLLVERNADVHSVNRFGMTPLMIAQELAAVNKNPEIPALLVKTGAHRLGVLPYDQALEDEGFILKDRLKIHLTGAIGKYKYVGPDADIKKFAGEKNEIILKTSAIENPKYKKMLDNEFNNASALQQNQNKEVLHRPRLMTHEIEGPDGKVPIIINECLYSNKAKTITKDYEQYLAELRSLHAGRAVINDPPNFATIFKNIYKALVKLHGEGFLHLDLASRNFIADLEKHNARLIDFGLSLKMDHYGNAIGDPRFTRIPEGFYNAEAKSAATGQKSIHTDLHSIKLTMLEMMFIYINKELKLVPSANDKEMIQSAIKILRDELNEIKDGRKAIVEEALAKIEPYLTSSYRVDQTHTSQSAAEYMKADQKNFDACYSPKLNQTSTASILNVMTKEPEVPKKPKSQPKVEMPDNKSMILDILTKSKELYSTKVQSGEFTYIDRFDVIIKQMNNTTSNQQRIEILNDFLSNEFKNRFESPSTLANNIAHLNKTIESWYFRGDHYFRVLALSVKDVYEKCKIPVTEQIPLIDRIENYPKVNQVEKPAIKKGPEAPEPEPIKPVVSKR